MTKKESYLHLIEVSYDKGSAAAKEDAANRTFYKPAKRAAAAGIVVMSAAGSAFIRGYLDSFPSDTSGAA
jgi:hypothetical protein